MTPTSHQDRSERCCGRGRGGQGRGRGGGRGRCGTSFVSTDLRPLEDEAHAAVLEALDDEHRAFALYSAILERFPGAMPFAHIVEAEGRHIELLASVLKAHGREVPANPHLGSPEMRRAVPASIACACDIAVEAEIDNVALYVQRLLPKVADHPDITEAFVRLMEASRDRHLPAFRRGMTGECRGGVA